MLRETRVNLRHLLEDIRDSYSLPVEEVIITELIANSLDSGASSIDFFVLPQEKAVICIDNGKGMSRKEIRAYHDIAATTKIKGSGIGFAGVGAKLSLLIGEKVITESRGVKGARCATEWHLASDMRAPWKFISFSRMASSRGTAIKIMLSDSNPILLNPAFVERIILVHFSSLFNNKIIESLLKHVYKKGVKFSINNCPILSIAEKPELPASTFYVRLPGSRKNIGVGHVVKNNQELKEGEYGIAVSTYGKVIKRGWEWLGLHPQHFTKIAGLVEIPGLSEILTTNKTDFLNDSSSLKKYYRYRKGIQHALLPILEKFGELELAPEQLPKRIKPLEKEIEKTLHYLAGDFPELLPLFGVRPGRPATNLLTEATADLVAVEAKKEVSEAQIDPAEQNKNQTSDRNKEKTAVKPNRGITIRFEENKDNTRLGHMVENTIWINQAHPAFKKAREKGGEDYHIVYTAAWVLSQFVEHETSPQVFLNRFLYAWGSGEKKPLSFFKSV